MITQYLLTEKEKLNFVLFVFMNRENNPNSSLLLFNDAYEKFIKGKTVVNFGFQQPKRVKMHDGNFAFPCGYYTTFNNGYKVIISGESLGSTPIQEVMILDPDGIPVARDTEDIRDVEF